MLQIYTFFLKPPNDLLKLFKNLCYFVKNTYLCTII